MIALEPISNRLWPSEDRTYKMTNEPFSDQTDINRSLDYTLSQGVTTCSLQADVRLRLMLIEAAERFTPMTENEQIAAVDEVKQYRLISAPQEASKDSKSALFQ